MKVDYQVQYCHVVTNPRWLTAANMTIVMSTYLDYDEIWYTG